MTPEQSLAICRFLNDGSLTFLWGALGLSALADPAVRNQLSARLQIAVPIAVGLVSVSAIASIPLQAALITDQWRSAVDPDALSLVSETRVGEALTARLVTSMVLLAAYVAKANRVIPVIAGVMLTELACVGHAVEGSILEGLLRQAIDAIHVLSATAWLGGLVAFILLLQMAKSHELKKAAVAAMALFSRLGHVAVALVIVSGVVNTWLIVGKVPTDLSSPYEVKLLCKTAAVAAMIVLAILNRYVLVPALRSRRSDLPCRLLVLASVGEIVLGLIALALVASFGLEDPA
ncbi:Putative transmembrane copper resistance protein [Rhizobium freirei PRF 81]|uniref:Putative transmembrane copper resistance protein n=1 Tax=Rhizobium freirei PRF 81 TaxID=363754 RepID=N6V718_9HYPH|nr:copper homeostasis membrane protein CopD [Rhizobium freirei]ENN86842.1 Putative transmembrane copper resistance protein [Rhizobium freirei PRF 81]